MKKSIAIALAAAACMLGSTAALATTALVTDYAGSTLLGSFDLSLTPVVDSYTLGNFTEVEITNGTGAAAGYSDAYFYNADPAIGGGIFVGDPVSSPINTTGPQSYTGPESAPVFLPGVYTEDDGTVLTISVPEPATWAMMLVGFGMVGFAARRRKLAVRTA